MRWLVLALLTVAVIRAADPQPATEERLRARVDEFYGDIKDKKFRDAESLIAPEDRDAYYNRRKPDLRYTSVQKIEWGADHKIANVTMNARTMLENLQVGKVEMPGSFLCHWKYENGDWWWFIPMEEDRDTPFGKMHFRLKPDPNAPPAPADQKSLAALIARGPHAADLAEAVKPSSSVFQLSPEPGSTAAVTLQNTSSVPVELTLGAIATKAFSAQLTSAKLAAGETVRLTVTRATEEKFDPGKFVVTVTPTQQRLVFEVRE